jgi:hypothetical protein
MESVKSKVVSVLKLHAFKVYWPHAFLIPETDNAEGLVRLPLARTRIPVPAENIILPYLLTLSVIQTIYSRTSACDFHTYEFPYIFVRSHLVNSQYTFPQNFRP